MFYCGIIRSDLHNFAIHLEAVCIQLWFRTVTWSVAICYTEFQKYPASICHTNFKYPAEFDTQPCQVVNMLTY